MNDEPDPAHFPELFVPDPPLTGIPESAETMMKEAETMMKDMKRWSIGGRPMYYDKDGTPLSLWDWSEKFRDREYCVVARDVVCDFVISTVWLGLDHGYGGMGALFPGYTGYTGDPRPVIFETMIFDQLASRTIMNGDRPRVVREGRYRERYCTLEEAQAGHLAAIEFARREGAARPAIAEFEAVVRAAAAAVAMQALIIRPPTGDGQDGEGLE